MTIRDEKQARKYLEGELKAAGYSSEDIHALLSAAQDVGELWATHYQTDEGRAYRDSRVAKYQTLLSKYGLSPDVMDQQRDIDQWWGGTFSSSTGTFRNRQVTSIYSELLSMVKGVQFRQNFDVSNLTRSLDQITKDSKAGVDAILKEVSHGYQSGSEDDQAYRNRIDEYAKSRLRGLGTFVSGAPITPVSTDPNTLQVLGLVGE